MSFDLETLYSLLPAYYRIKDSEQGEPLRALLSVIAEAVAVLEEDLEQLYDDQFIETCSEWAVPYIGDLVGVKPLNPHLGGAAFSQRALIANTLGYRRRKGTARVLEQLAHDVTGWPAKAVEFFKLMATAQNLNHLRSDNLFSPNMRDVKRLERLNTPFDETAHSVDVRLISKRQGKYNIPNVGIFLWRMKGFSLIGSPAYKVGARRYMFNPLGCDMQLYGRSAEEQGSIPVPIRCMILKRDLEGDFHVYYPPSEYSDDLAGRRQGSLALMVDGRLVRVEEIVCADLSDGDPSGGTWKNMPSERYAIDPEKGRLALPKTPSLGHEPEVRVSFQYGFSDEIGGGSYGRVTSFSADTQTVEEAIVPSSFSSVESALKDVTKRIREAKETRREGIEKDFGIVEIVDNGIYSEALSIMVQESSHVELRAADGHRPLLAIAEKPEYALAGTSLASIRPMGLAIGGKNDSEMTLNGLVIGDGPLIVEGRLSRLKLRHCTLVPGLGLSRDGQPNRPKEPSLIITSPDTVVDIDHCIVGGIRIAEGAKLSISNSIVDSTSKSGVAYCGWAGDESKSIDPGGELWMENCTVIGKVYATAIKQISNSIILALKGSSKVWPSQVQAVHAQHQQGCLRFSYLPVDSHVPRRYRCRPDGKEQDSCLRLEFASLRYGQPGYCQLSMESSPEILRGASDGSEMGAFHDLYQPQREANLKIMLDEYLRFGLEAGIFYES
jgi:hypothetical protein